MELSHRCIRCVGIEIITEQDNLILISRGVFLNDFKEPFKEASTSELVVASFDYLDGDRPMETNR